MEQNKNGISASIIADSLNEHGQRLTTFVLVFPRIVLAEFNTHRMLSKNSASSRAIPFEKMVKMVQENPFIPIKWMKDHKGMQGNEYLEDTTKSYTHTENGVVMYQWTGDITTAWLNGRNSAVHAAKLMNGLQVTKQLCNRLLEPFMWHTVICTGSEWENFFALRANDQAEIHIQELAYKMLEAYNQSKPKQLKAGEWHIPFGDKMELDSTSDKSRIELLSKKINHTSMAYSEDIEQLAIKIATARCARVSYLNFEGKDDYEADIRLHDMLIKSGHFSPTEHCAVAADDAWYGNFRGWKQYRKFLENENRRDSRVQNKFVQLDKK